MNTETTPVVETPTTPAVAQTADDSFDLGSYRSDRSGTPAATTEEPAEPADGTTTPDATGEPEDENAADTGTAEDTETDEPEGEPGDESLEHKKGKGGFQKRISKLTGERDRLNAENAALKAQLAGTPAAKPTESASTESQGVAPAAFTKPKPTLEDSDSVEDFTDKLIEWKEEKKAYDKAETDRLASEKQKGQQVVNDWNTRKAASKQAHADYDTVMSKVDDVKLTPALQHILLDSEHGPELAYQLASNRAELEKFAKLSPLQAAKHIARLELSIKPATPPKPETKVSGAPAPIRPVGGTKAAAGRVDIGNMTSDDYRRARQTGRIA